jgi:hypothetical protein
LLAADKYNIPDLVKICVNHLKTNLTEVNAVEVMTKSYMINQKDLFDAARKFVQFCKNSGKPVEMEALEEVKETNPTLALKMLSQAMFHTETTTSRDSGSKKSLIFSIINSFVAYKPPKFRASPNIFLSKYQLLVFLCLLFAEKINSLLVNQQKFSQLKLVCVLRSCKKK